MQKLLHYVPPEAIQAIEPDISSGLQSIYSRQKIKRWTIPAVIQALKESRAGLYLCIVDKKYCGFVILQRLQEPSVVLLHIWCAYNNSKHDLIDLFIDDIKNIGMLLGAKYLTFGSSRKWSRRLKAYGFQEATTEVFLEIQGDGQRTKQHNPNQQNRVPVLGAGRGDLGAEPSAESSPNAA